MRQWTNPSQPQTLQIAVFLLYINAVFALLFARPFGLLFLAALPFSPLISVFGGSLPIPDPAGGNDPLFVSPVTAPALIVVGFLMMTAVRLIPWERFDEAIPAFLTILTLPLTFNISYGIGFGFISYCVIKLSRGRAGEVHPLLYGAALLFALAFVWPALQGLLSRT